MPKFNAVVKLSLFIALASSGVCLCQCPTNKGVDADPPTPKLNPVSVGDTIIVGQLVESDGKPAAVPGGSVRICIDGTQLGTDWPVSVDGHFSAVTTAVAAASVGKVVIAQFTSSAVGAIRSALSSIKVEAAKISCASAASSAAGAPAQPKLKISSSGYSGSVAGATSGTVRICVNDSPAAAGISISSDGSFKGSGLTLKAGDKVVAQASNAAGVYGNASKEYVVPAVSHDQETNLLLIGGVEQSGYSSLGQSTSPFVNAFLQGPVSHGIGAWGRIRLLGAAQPSTQGIVSTFTDPTGQLTTQDYTKVGTSMDFMLGPTFKLSPTDSGIFGWSIIAAIGGTTPLSSQTVALTYKAPPAGSVECATLTKRFTVANGYAPGLTQAPSGAATCLSGGYTDVSFSNQDRSSFLRKWEFGFRSSAAYGCKAPANCNSQIGVLDMTIGQDESVTRGLLRHLVFKVDGVLPIPIKGSSLLYLFGSTYLRTWRNQDQTPLILQTETATVTVPSSTVIVLPLQQPDRDFYRLGVGLNINQVFCKMLDNCPTTPSAPK